MSFAELESRVLSLAAALRQLDVRPGTRVAFHLPTGPECVQAYLACFCLGAVAVPLDFQLKADELTACLEHCEAAVLIAQPRPDVDLLALRRRVGALSHLMVTAGEIEGAVSWPASPAAGNRMPSWTALLPDAAPAEDDPALIMYTSGTTGRPKGILLNYRHLDESPRALHHFVDLTSDDVKLCAIPLTHVGGFIYIQNCLIFGITLILMERFHPYEFLKQIQKHRVTCFHIVPPMYNALLTLKQIERFDLSSLRWVVVFGAPSSPDVLERFHRYCPNARLLNGWGMTETCPPNTVTPPGSDNIASIGKPSPYCVIRIVDENGQDAAAGQTGELIISGDGVMAGYYKDPERTAEVLRGGWLHTGDIGRYDTEGFLYICGRKKEMIKVGGQIVFAPEVEAALLRHEGIVEAAVIGMPDTLRGESIQAFVRTVEGADVTPEDIRYFAREHLAHFKVPQAVRILPELPKNRAGKIDKNRLGQIG